jgi:hypothetical protein
MRSQGKLKLLILLLLSPRAFLSRRVAVRRQTSEKRRIERKLRKPAAVEVTTAAAIKRDLPRFFEATGSLAATSKPTSRRKRFRQSRRVRR